MTVQRLFICLLATNYLLSSPASLAAVNQTEVDLLTLPNPRSIADKRRSTALTPKWSLPFQGQLGTVPVPSAQASPTPASTKSTATKSAATKPAATTPIATKPTAGDDLALFKPKKYEVLNLAPQETLNNTLIADASAVVDTNNLPIKTGKLISGGVSVWDGPFDVDRIINHLLDAHFENSPEGKKLDAQVKRHSGLGHRSVAVAKDALYEGLGYQGIDPSMRAGKLILDSPDIKIRNKAWAEYARQKYIDKIHAEVVMSLMQVSEGIGSNETEHGKQAIASGEKELSALVGDEEAARAVKGLTAWLSNINVPYSAFAQTPWSTIEHTKVQEEVLKLAIDRDPVIAGITTRLKKFAYPSQWNRRSSQIIQTALNGATIFAPGNIPVACASMEVAYKLGTGGSEENKIERELLFDKRIQSRLKVLTQESSMALDNYRYALVTKNPPLLAFSQEVLENLTGTAPPSLAHLISTADYDSTNTFVPAIKETADDNTTAIAGTKVHSLARSARQLTICPGHNAASVAQ